MPGKNSIDCPNCGTNIPIEEALFNASKAEAEKQFENEKKLLQQNFQQKIESIKSEFSSKSAQFEKEFKLRLDEVDKQKSELDKLKSEQEETLKKMLDSEKSKIESKLKRQIEEENKEKLLSKEKELQELREKSRELTKKEIEIERLKRAGEELEEQMNLRYERELSEKIRAEKEKMSEKVSSLEEELTRKIADENHRKMSEKDKIIADMKKQVEELKRKSEQGSQQTQGEAFELEIEDLLAKAFPFDSIEEVKKGQRGADSVQLVKNNLGETCGKILYESKSTKTFNNNWISKLRQDQIEEGADIAIIVTQALPEGITNTGLMEGVWVSSFDAFIGLATALREGILNLHSAMASQKNRGDKMNMIYDYLTGNEFRMHVEAIIEGFTAMQVQLKKEQRSMERIWKEREKQIESVLKNTSQFYGAIKGIAGAALPTISALELDSGDEPNLLE
jgi:hypothetical protein